MTPNEELPQLLGSLYAAPLQPEMWQVFFDQLCHITTCSIGYLLSGDEEMVYSHLAGGGSNWDAIEAVPHLHAHYLELDPFAVPLFSNPRIAVVAGEELISQDKLRRTEFYNDFMRYIRGETVTIVSCSPTAEIIDAIAIWRTKQDGRLDGHSMALLEAVLPHARTALNIRRKLREADAQRHLSTLAFEAISSGAFLVTGSGRVAYMNSRAAQLVGKADALRLERSVLTAIHPTEAAQLRRLIAGAVPGGRVPERSQPGGAVRISRRGNTQSLLAMVLPAPEPTRSALTVPFALVLVTDPADKPQSRAELMRLLYRLTPTEARLADLLLQGLDMRQAAERMPTTYESARACTKQIFAKTGARRQSELMRLMLSLPGTPTV